MAVSPALQFFNTDAPKIRVLFCCKVDPLISSKLGFEKWSLWLAHAGYGPTMQMAWHALCCIGNGRPRQCHAMLWPMPWHARGHDLCHDMPWPMPGHAMACATARQASAMASERVGVAIAVWLLPRCIACVYKLCQG